MSIGGFTGYTGDTGGSGLFGSSGYTQTAPPSRFEVPAESVMPDTPDIATMTPVEIAADRELAIRAVLVLCEERVTAKYPKVKCSIAHSIDDDGDVRVKFKLQSVVSPSEAAEVNQAMLDIWNEVRDHYDYVIIGSEFVKLVATVESASLTNDQFAKVFGQVFDAKKA